MYCLCKKRHGSGDFTMFFAAYREYSINDHIFWMLDGDCDALYNDRERGWKSVDYWMDAFALDKEASHEVD
jgi:hypothetical protein